MATITRINLATNPSFEYPDFLTTSRMNLCACPSFETGLSTGWTDGANSTAAVSTVQKWVGTQSYAVTRSNATVGGAYARITFNATAGLDYSVGIYVYGGAGAAGSYQAKMTGAVNSTILTFNPPGAVWTRIIVSGTATSTGTVNFYVNDDTNLAPVLGTVFYVDGCMIEQATLVGAYFDGDTANTANTAYVWSGATGLSTTQSFPMPSVGGIDTATKMSTGGSATVYQDPSWVSPGSEGYVSLRVDSSSASATSTSCYPFQLGVGMVRMGVQPGHTYTVSAACRLTQAQTGPLDVSARAITFGTVVSGVTNYVAAVSPAAPNAAGVTRLSVTFTVPLNATNCFLRLMNGEGTIASGGSGGSVWWDDLLIEEVGYARPYFDGNTAPFTNALYSPPGQTSFSWTGATDRSVSVETDVVPLQDYQVQLPDGSLLGAGQPVGLLEITGLKDSANLRSADTDNSQQDGSSPGMSFVSKRAVAFKFQIAGPAGGAAAAYSPLAANWQNTRDPSTVAMTAGQYLSQLASGGSLPVSAVQVQLPGQPAAYLLLGKPTKLGLPVDFNYQLDWWSIGAEWTLPDGLIYGAVPNMDNCTVLTSSGGAPFKWTFPVVFPGSSGGTLTAANGGSYPALPVLRITGPVNTPRVMNTATGQAIQVNLSLNPGDVLVVDFAARAIRLNGANRNTALDLSSSFFTVPPGGVGLRYSSSDSSPVASLLTVYTLDTYSTIA